MRLPRTHFNIHVMNTHPPLIIIATTLCLAAMIGAKEPGSPETAATVRPWPAEDKPDGFTVVQEGEGLSKILSITSKQSGKKLTFIADGRMIVPTVLKPHNGWPQIELISDGPPEFLWRKLYRVEGGDYRCARIDEFTRQPSQVPASAPVVDLGSGYILRLLRSRDLAEDDADSFEAFTTETPSPDGKILIRFSYEPEWLAKVEIAGTQSKEEPQKLYDFEVEGYAEAISFVRWRPDSGAFAFHVTQGPRVSSTTLFEKVGDEWKATELPQVKLPIDEDLNVRREFVEPLRWTDARTLELKYSGDYTDEGEPGSYYFKVVIRWGKDGKAKVLSVKATGDDPEP